MKTKTKVTLFVIAFIIVLVAGYFLSNMEQSVPQNPAGTIGNTPGNLNNGGLFCESDGKVYFSNAYDNGMLYCMNPDETDIRKLTQSEVYQINAAGDYLYFYQKNASSEIDLHFIARSYGLYRSKKNGKGLVALDRSDCKYVSLADNTIYYSKPVDNHDTLQLYAIGTDKKNNRKISDHLVNPSSVANSQIYYNGTDENHYLYSFDTLTGTETLIKEYNMWFPTLHGGSIYFLDLNGNYELCRYDLGNDTMTMLTTSRVDIFNVTDQYIYYQTVDTDSPALMRMGLDGSNPEIVSPGTYSDINVTSQYVYFRSFAADIPVYRTPANGAINVTSFDAARDAAFEEMNE